MDMKLVSVLIPSYNHRPYIKQCIESIVSQDYENVELIIIDDSSTDGTYQEIQALIKAYNHRFQGVFISQNSKNLGVSATLNRGLEIAEGEYLLIVASDDFLLPGAISSLVKAISQKPEAVLCVPDNIFVDKNGQQVGWDFEGKVVSFEQSQYRTFGQFLCTKEHFKFVRYFKIYNQLLFHNFLPNGRLFRLNSIKEVAGFSPKFSPEDWYINIQLAKVGQFLYLPEELFAYRTHDSNTVRSKAYIEKYFDCLSSLIKNEQEYNRTVRREIIWKTAYLGCQRKKLPSISLIDFFVFKTFYSIYKCVWKMLRYSNSF